MTLVDRAEAGKSAASPCVMSESSKRSHPARALRTSRMHRGARVLALVLCGAAACTALTGCLVASDRKSTVSGREVTSAELDAIKVGTTTETDVLARLGPPSTTTELSDGGKMHTWSATSRETSSGAVFLIFASSSVKETKRSVMVSCKDGVVTHVHVK
jgi:outer membrane protein assembly factor BamE (lipoprotein component of BamABCDE complex)